MEVFKQKFLEEQWQYVVKENDRETQLEVRKLNGKTTVYYENQRMTLDELIKYNLEIVKKVFVRSPIARPPPNGYQVRVPFSRKSIAWLELLMHRARKKRTEFEYLSCTKRKGRIQSSRNAISTRLVCVAICRVSQRNSL